MCSPYPQKNPRQYFSTQNNSFYHLFFRSILNAIRSQKFHFHRFTESLCYFITAWFVCISHSLSALSEVFYENIFLNRNYKYFLLYHNFLHFQSQTRIIITENNSHRFPDSNCNWVYFLSRKPQHCLVPDYQFPTILLEPVYHSAVVMLVLSNSISTGNKCSESAHKVTKLQKLTPACQGCVSVWEGSWNFQT